MGIDKRSVDIGVLLQAIERAIGEPSGSVKGIICTVVFQDDTLGLFHNAPDLHVASEVFATAITAVAEDHGLRYDVEFL